jgi:hypothetical protein
MKQHLDCLVPLALVRHADRVGSTLGQFSDEPPQKPRVAELRRRVLGGYYATDAMMDALARRILDSGDL